MSKKFPLICENCDQEVSSLTEGLCKACLALVDNPDIAPDIESDTIEGEV